VRYLIGIGTYTGFDDSIGLRVAEAIAEEGLERGFRVVDLGGDLIDLVHYLGADTESVLIVDSARMGMAPGEFAFFTPEQVETNKPLAGLSTHEGDLMRILGLAASLGSPVPPITIMGIQPGIVRPESGLSEAVGGRLREYVDAAVEFFADGAEEADSRTAPTPRTSERGRDQC
jgi:hydrogenase maturation protease